MKPLISAAIGYVSTPMLLESEGSKFNFNGTAYSTATVGAVLGAGATLASELAGMAMYPYVKNNARLRSYNSMVLSLSSGGIAYAVLPKLMNSAVESSTMKKLFVGGAASQALTEYIYENVVAPDENANRPY
jgi:hypothetical protein